MFEQHWKHTSSPFPVEYSELVISFGIISYLDYPYIYHAISIYIGKYQYYCCVELTASRQAHSTKTSNAHMFVWSFQLRQLRVVSGCGVMWCLWELVSELVYLLISSVFLVPTLWDTNNQDMKTIYTWTARELGRLRGTCEQGNPSRGCVYLCLLYTSPSPRDQRGSRMPSSA